MSPEPADKPAALPEREQLPSGLGEADAKLIAGAIVDAGLLSALGALLLRGWWRQRRVRKAPPPSPGPAPESNPVLPISAAKAALDPDLPNDRRPAYPHQPAVAAKSDGHDGAVVGASVEAVRRGFELLSTSTRALKFALVLFLLVGGVMLWGLSLLLRHYLAYDRQMDPAMSAAPVLRAVLAAPLEPIPRHNELDWQDLVHLRQDEDAQFRARGWSINGTTGEPILQAVVLAGLRQQQNDRSSPAAETDPLRFPPTLAPVRAGAASSLDRSDLFPPVGAAAAADQLKQSIYRPPSNTADVKDLPAQSGSADRQNEPSATAP